jgi:hypothetical protein
MSLDLVSVVGLLPVLLQELTVGYFPFVVSLLSSTLYDAGGTERVEVPQKDVARRA